MRNEEVSNLKQMGIEKQGIGNEAFLISAVSAFEFV
jgi:hypothetical protein